jgi:hypothetical protein
MESDIQLLELASGIKDSLIKAGFLSVSSILNSTTTDISNKVVIDLYIAQIILEEARKATTTSSASTTAVKLDYLESFNKSLTYAQPVDNTFRL